MRRKRLYFVGSVDHLFVTGDCWSRGGVSSALSRCPCVEDNGRVEVALMGRVLLPGLDALPFSHSYHQPPKKKPHLHTKIYSYFI